MVTQGDFWQSWLFWVPYVVGLLVCGIAGIAIALGIVTFLVAWICDTLIRHYRLYEAIVGYAWDVRKGRRKVEYDKD
jgi:hypothetical protein